MRIRHSTIREVTQAGRVVETRFPASRGSQFWIAILAANGMLDERSPEFTAAVETAADPSAGSGEASPRP